MTYLRPDGKSQVTVQYEYGYPIRVDTVVVSTQHADYVDPQQIRTDVIEHIIKPTIPAHMLDSKTNIYVNPTGRKIAALDVIYGSALNLVYRMRIMNQ